MYTLFNDYVLMSRKIFCVKPSFDFMIGLYRCATTIISNISINWGFIQICGRLDREILRKIWFSYRPFHKNRYLDPVHW